MNQNYGTKVGKAANRYDCADEIEVGNINMAAATAGPGFNSKMAATPTPYGREKLTRYEAGHQTMMPPEMRQSQ